jgi:hypothetical protein
MKRQGKSRFAADARLASPVLYHRPKPERSARGGSEASGERWRARVNRSRARREDLTPVEWLGKRNNEVLRLR